MYIIGSDLIPQFVKVSSKNIGLDGKHVETLAFLIGYFEKDNYIATDLIFPSQLGQPHKVDDLGMYDVLEILDSFSHIVVRQSPSGNHSKAVIVR